MLALNPLDVKCLRTRVLQQLFQDHISVFQIFSDERNFLQMGADAVEQFGFNVIGNLGEVFPGGVDEGPDLRGDNDILDGTEKMFNGVDEFFGEKLLVSGEVSVDIVERSRQLRWNQFTDSLASFVDLLEEVINGFRAYNS